MKLQVPALTSLGTGPWLRRREPVPTPMVSANNGLAWVTSLGRTGTHAIATVLNALLKQGCAVHEPDVIALRELHLLPKKAALVGWDQLKACWNET